jgi:hypothetical protein
MKKLNIGDKYVPLIILGVCLLSFSILLPQLGYYWDDWLTLYLTYTYEEPNALIYYPYRPIHAWMDVFTLSLIGLRPLFWHILSLVFRWLAAWGVWEVLKRIWPEHKHKVAWIAVLFTVYPAFSQQSVAVIFRPHWFTFVFFLLSLILMLEAYKNKKRFLVYTLLGVITTAVHLFNSEYLVGLELARPTILLLVVMRDVEEWKKRSIKVLKQWIPYALVFIIFIIWRFFIVQIENDPNPPLDLSEILTKPSNLVELFVISIRDMLHTLITSWYQTLQPSLISVDRPSDLIAWGIALFSFGALYFVLLVGKISFGNDVDEKQWTRQALLIGLFATFVALVPIWLTGRKVIVGMWSDRLSLPAMFGASIFIVALVTLLIPRKVHRGIFLCLLVSLAIANQFRIGNDYRWDWIRQKRTYWQFYWRAPAIEPNTPIIGDGALTRNVSRYSAAFALNMLYPQDETNPLPSYWYFEVYYNKLANRVPQILEGMPLSDEFYSVNFKAESDDSILIFTPSGEDRCIWFLSPLDVKNADLPTEVRQLAEISNLDRINPEANNDSYPLEDIFGPEPEHTWCYYFQKASLARQYHDWKQVIVLGNEAENKGFSPKFGYELIPFIEANMAFGQLNEAVELTKKAIDMKGSAAPMLCVAWEDYYQNDGSREEYIISYDEVMRILNCP